MQAYVEKVVNSEHEIPQPRNLKKELMLLGDSYYSKAPEVVYEHTYDDFSDGSILLLKDPCASAEPEGGLQNQLEKVSMCFRITNDSLLNQSNYSFLW